jgi:hypothetical protein
MSEREPEVESGEELIDEQGRTQRELDGDEPGPAATTDSDEWDETNDEPHQGEGGQDIV